MCSVLSKMSVLNFPQASMRLRSGNCKSSWYINDITFIFVRYIRQLCETSWIIGKWWPLRACLYWFAVTLPPEGKNPNNRHNNALHIRATRSFYSMGHCFDKQCRVFDFFFLFSFFFLLCLMGAVIVTINASCYIHVEISITFLHCLNRSVTRDRKFPKLLFQAISILFGTSHPATVSAVKRE